MNQPTVFKKLDNVKEQAKSSDIKIKIFSVAEANKKTSIASTITSIKKYKGTIASGEDKVKNSQNSELLLLGMGKLTGNKQIGAHAIVDGSKLFQTDEIDDKKYLQLKGDDDIIKITSKEFSGCNISSLSNFKNFKNIVNYEYNVTAIQSFVARNNQVLHVIRLILIIQEYIISGCANGSVYLYEPQLNLGNILDPQISKLNQDEIFRQILYDHADIVSDIRVSKLNDALIGSHDGRYDILPFYLLISMSIWSLQKDELRLKRLFQSKHHQNYAIYSCSFLDNDMNSTVISGGSSKKLIQSDIKQKRDHVISQPNKGYIRKIKASNYYTIAVAFDHGQVCLYDIRKIGDFSWNSAKGQHNFIQTINFRQFSSAPFAIFDLEFLYESNSILVSGEIGIVRASFGQQGPVQFSNIGFNQNIRAILCSDDDDDDGRKKSSSYFSSDAYGVFGKIQF